MATVLARSKLRKIEDVRDDELEEIIHRRWEAFQRASILPMCVKVWLVSPFLVEALVGLNGARGTTITACSPHLAAYRLDAYVQLGHHIANQIESAEFIQRMEPFFYGSPALEQPQEK